MTDLFVVRIHQKHFEVSEISFVLIKSEIFFWNLSVFKEFLCCCMRGFKAVGSPLVGFPASVFSILASDLRSWRSVHPQTKIHYLLQGGCISYGPCFTGEFAVFRLPVRRTFCRILEFGVSLLQDLLLRGTAQRESTVIRSCIVWDSNPFPHGSRGQGPGLRQDCCCGLATRGGWRLGGEEVCSSYSFLTSALEGGEWSASRPGRALPPPPRKEPPVPIV
jgi:hypothetical protein